MNGERKGECLCVCLCVCDIELTKERTKKCVPIIIFRKLKRKLDVCVCVIVSCAPLIAHKEHHQTSKAQIPLARSMCDLCMFTTVVALNCSLRSLVVLFFSIGAKCQCFVFNHHTNIILLGQPKTLLLVVITKSVLTVRSFRSREKTKNITNTFL